ncbi:hypothetical protein VI817_005237 [Penicillium citrinum]|nr:hypothetical protein VI817_005237 [Penicillium citrinum]
MISYSQRAIHRNADRHGMQPAQLDTLDDPDQTGLETAVHDTERTELSSTSDTLQALWPKRLEDLARRTVTSSAFSLDGEAAQSIHHHLDALEKIFGEMRTETTEDVQDPSQDNSPGSIVPDISVIEVHSSQPVQPTVSSVPSESDDGIDKEKILSQLKSLDSEVIALNKEIEQRRKESSEIRDLFEERCRGLARTVAELEDEVIEL